jgi:hypothetical protein
VKDSYGNYAVRYYNTKIITYILKGNLRLNNGGYANPSTHNRIIKYTGLTHREGISMFTQLGESVLAIGSYPNTKYYVFDREIELCQFLDLRFVVGDEGMDIWEMHRYYSKQQYKRSWVSCKYCGDFNQRFNLTLYKRKLQCQSCAEKTST